MNTTPAQANLQSLVPNPDWQAWVWAGWEPNRHYRRTGRSGTSYFGRGQWIDAWRKRLESPQIVKALADAKLNVLVTRFYKGFGIEAESAEWPELQAFVALAHEHGLRVLGYTQGSSIYYETLLQEQPEAMSWAARHHDGSVQTWGGAYYRLRPCLNNQNYLAYMKDVIDRGAHQIKLDGIHIDNSYYRHCWCDTCKVGFRKWLDARGDLDERMGVPNASHIEPPPLRTGMETYSDPLAILWILYGTHVRNEAYDQLIGKARESFESPLIAGNPAFPRRSVYLPELALDISHEAKNFDVLFAENGNLPAADAKHLVTQAEAYLLADAHGYKIFNTAWNTATDQALSPQTTGELWAAMAEEFSYHTAIPGNNWWLRPASNGSDILMDNETLTKPYTKMIQWFESIHSIIRRAQLEQWAEIALYIQPLTLSLAWHTDRTAMRLAIAAMMRLRIPIVLAIAQQPIPKTVRTLLVLEQTCLSDQDMNQITQFAKRDDCNAVIMGSSGSCDEWFIPRNIDDVIQWRSGIQMHSDQGNPLNWEGEQQGDRYMSADKLTGLDRAVSQLSNMLGKHMHARQFNANLPDHVMVNVETAGEQTVIHLRDQSGAGQANEQCTLQLSSQLMGSREARFYWPQEDNDRYATNEVKLSSQVANAPAAEDGRLSQPYIELSLPAWKHYAVVVVTR